MTPPAVCGAPPLRGIREGEDRELTPPARSDCAARRSSRSRPRRRRPASARAAACAPCATPEGVPVMMMSPGSSVMTLESSCTRVGTSKIRSSVLLSCMTSPLTRVMMRSGARARRQLVGGHDVGAEAAGAVEVLAQRELAARLPLPVAHRAVVEAGVAGDHAERLLLRHVAALLADHDGELGLPVELVGVARPRHLAVVRHQRVVEAAEHDRIGRDRAAGLLGVLAVVEADAQDLARVGDRAAGTWPTSPTPWRRPWAWRRPWRPRPGPSCRRPGSRRPTSARAASAC